MSDFIGESEIAAERLPRRFPEESFGFRSLRELRSFSADELNSILRDLIELQRNVPERRNLPRPRVFISHQRRNKNRAVIILKLATTMGFDYWLDVDEE